MGWGEGSASHVVKGMDIEGEKGQEEVSNQPRGETRGLLRTQDWRFEAVDHGQSLRP